MMPLESCNGGQKALKSSRDPKIMDYSLRKRPEMPEILSFDDAARVPGHRNLPGSRNLWTIAHENGQKCPKSRVLTMPLESCNGGHMALKSSWDPKPVSDRPRKRPEMPEITSFDNVATVVYGWSQGIAILPGPENCGL